MIDTLYVVPCGREKKTTRAPAQELYNGSHFQYVYMHVEAAAERASDAQIRILSTKHGLLDPDQVIAPYEMTISDRRVGPLKVSRQLEKLAPRIVVALMSHSHLKVLEAALASLERRTGAAPVLVDVYDGCRGVGQQRQRAATCL